MNAELEQINNSRKWAKERFKSKMQRIATLREAIYALSDVSHSQRMGLFISLFMLRMEHKTQFEQLRKLLADKNLEQVKQIVHEFNIMMHWKEANSAVDDGIIHSHTKSIQNLQNALTQIVELINTSANQASNLLYKDLHTIIEGDRKHFGFRTFSSHTRLMIETIIQSYSFKDGMTIYDGAAHTGFLATSLSEYIPHCIVELEEANPNIYRLGQQLQSLKGRPIPTFYQNNAKLGKSKFEYGKADFYISFPNTPESLTQSEASAIHDYLVTYRSGELSQKATAALWVQYALQCLNSKGMAFIAIEDGFFRRSGYDKQVREYLVNNQFIEMIIHLDSSEYKSSQYTSISLLVLDKAPKENNHKIKLIDLRSRNSSFNSYDEEVRLISQLILTNEYNYQRFVEIGQIPNTRLDLSYSEAIASEYNLTFDFYRRADESEKPTSLEEAKQAYGKAQQDAIKASKRFEHIIDQLQNSKNT